jgi:hypothetical protein
LAVVERYRGHVIGIREPMPGRERPMAGHPPSHPLGLSRPKIRMRRGNNRWTPTRHLDPEAHSGFGGQGITVFLPCPLPDELTPPLLSLAHARVCLISRV